MHPALPLPIIRSYVSGDAAVVVMAVVSHFGGGGLEGESEGEWDERAE